MPMYEEPELLNVSASPQYNAALPLGPHSRPANTQALQLGTNGDILFGRADNGARLECSVNMRWRLHLAMNDFVRRHADRAWV